MDMVTEFLAVRQRHAEQLARSNASSTENSLRRSSKRPTCAHLEEGKIHVGDAAKLLSSVESESVALSVWSPPYFVGKQYESDLTFESWKILLKKVIKEHFRLLKPGGFIAINIADILCFQDEQMPKLQAEVLNGRRSSVTRDDVLAMQAKYPAANRHMLAKLLGCSEQTVDRRLHGNNIRGGKYEAQTRVKMVGGLIEDFALQAGLYPYDRRVWIKDPAWENSRWASSSYRAIDEFEYIYFIWKPGVTTIDRSKLSPAEWSDWGARAVWSFRSVRANDDHEAKFPLELPRRVIRLLSSPGDLVLDCFMGSGTTAVAAIEEGRRFIGIERSAHYTKLASASIGKMLRFPNVARSAYIEPRLGSAGANREVFLEASGTGSLGLSTARVRTVSKRKR